MLDLGMITTIIGAITWLHSFGKEDIKGVKQETEELLSDLAKSLVNLFDITQSINELSQRLPSLSDAEFTAAFRDVQGYAERFYFNDEAISSARTHCGDVERDIERIKFKIVNFLRVDLGRWKEADQSFDQIVHDDNRLLQEYEDNVNRLKQGLVAVASFIEKAAVAEARRRYEALGSSLQKDLDELRKGVDEMKSTYAFVRGIVA